MNKRIKGNSKILKKPSRARAGSEVGELKQNMFLPQRVFLYLHAKSITYPLDDLSSLKPEIELEHQFNTITTLSDHHVCSNIIKLNQLDVSKPTFSITIEQDSLEEITRLADYPIVLTLYVYTINNAKEIVTDDQNCEEIRTPVAQGHIDIIEYFHNKRTTGTDTVFLYPLKSFGQHLSCKTVWEIYSLHPLLRNVTFSNYLFLSFDALYNIDQALMNNYQNLMANLSFISKIPDEKNNYKKIFICNFKIFSKTIIAEQNLTKAWETLKSSKLGNFNCMGIASECKIVLNQLFAHLLCTENVKFDFNGINKNEDIALICNSMHRYILTDNMQKILEEVLAQKLYQIVVEICTTDDESKVLLQGYVDLSVFLYPHVNNCSFAVALRPPVYTSKAANGNKSAKRKNRMSIQQVEQESKIPFATLQICLLSPITNPRQEINTLSHQRPNNNKFCQYPTILPKNIQFSLRSNCDYNYKAFDDLILEVMDYIINNNIQTLDDDKEFFCHQLSNMSNKIMKLLACDFNIKTPTKTNTEFTQLITTVYRDLIKRISENIDKCSFKSLKNCIFTDITVQNSIVTKMSLAKYLHEVDNLKMANIIMEYLRSEYDNNTMLKFYICIYDIERQRFDQVQKYLESALDDKDTEGELFANLIQIYINYKLQLQDPERNETAEEDLIKVLSNYCECQNATPLTGFVLLYCVYKRHSYQPGMAYCRWCYENLFDSIFIKLEFIPKSLWDIYMPYKINAQSIKGQNFAKVCYNLLRLGLYTFAQWVFNELADECLEIERYFFASTLTVLDNKLQENIQIRNVSFDKSENSMQLHHTLSLVNGNLEYFLKPESADCIRHYGDIAELNEQEISNYQIAVLRYAYKKMMERNYEEASQVFLRLCSDEITGIVAAIERGTACYHLGQLDEAEKYFALSTEYGIYLEDVWAFLALINLKKGNNYNALECWKYARLNQNYTINKDILDELNKINYSDINLFVDVPNNI